MNWFYVSVILFIYSVFVTWRVAVVRHLFLWSNGEWRKEYEQREYLIEREQGRWQNAIYQRCCDIAGPNAVIDGAGCESGDPLDVTLSEINQMASYVEEKERPLFSGIGGGSVQSVKASQNVKRIQKLLPTKDSKWYKPDEVSREIWDGDLWWWDDGETVFPVNIGWCVQESYFFACVGQWGWNRPQPLNEMGGLWKPCLPPDRKLVNNDVE